MFCFEEATEKSVRYGNNGVLVCMQLLASYKNNENMTMTKELAQQSLKARLLTANFRLPENVILHSCSTKETFLLYYLLKTFDTPLFW